LFQLSFFQFRGDVLFENLYQSHPAKILALGFSTACALCTTPFIVSLISYQENNHYRILIGHLITSNLSTLLYWNVTVQVHPTTLKKNEKNKAFLELNLMTNTSTQLNAYVCND
jgi:hypothetical protein